MECIYLFEFPAQLFLMLWQLLAGHRTVFHDPLEPVRVVGMANLLVEAVERQGCTPIGDLWLGGAQGSCIVALLLFAVTCAHLPSLLVHTPMFLFQGLQVVSGKQPPIWAAGISRC